MDPELFAEIIAAARDWDFENEDINDSFTAVNFESDYFAIDYTEGDIWLFSANGVRGDITIYDADGNIVVSPARGRFGPAEFDARFGGVASGTYYVQVRDSGQRGTFFDEGPYTLSATRLIDEAGDTIETATALTLGDTISGEFEYKEDADIFSLDVVEGQVLSFDIPDVEAIFQILDADGNVLAITSGSGQTLTSAFFDFNYTADADQTIYISLTWSRGPSGTATIPDYDYSFTVTDITPAPFNIIDGTAGNDNILGTSDNDDIAGFDGDDKLFGIDGNDKLFGGDGNDFLNGGRGDDELFGDAGHDELFGFQGDDYLEGGGGRDLLNGGDGQDGLFGGNGKDRLYGGAGDDFLSGGNGNDLLRGEAGADSLFGDAGHDSLNGGQADDYLSGGDGDDRLFGGRDDDILSGDTGQDRLYGQIGDDALEGGAGNDVLFGGAGNDYLSGGTGNDLLIGGAGADIFKFEANSGRDKILDFNLHQDRIDFSDGLIAFQDFEDVKDSAVQIGDDLHLMAGDGNRLIIEDFHIDDLDAELFIFV